MEEELLKSIDNKLAVLIKLLAGSLIQGKGKTEAIITLGICGLDVDNIANIVGTTNQTVSVRLSEYKKKIAVEKKKVKAEEN